MADAKRQDFFYIERIGAAGSAAGAFNASDPAAPDSAQAAPKQARPAISIQRDRFPWPSPKGAAAVSEGERGDFTMADPLVERAGMFVKRVAAGFAGDLSAIGNSLEANEFRLLIKE